MKFPTLHCRCPNNHTWGTLVPINWFRLVDLNCPHCDQPADTMKAGDWRNLDEVKKAQEKPAAE
jgi:hypothetical protein